MCRNMHLFPGMSDCRLIADSGDQIYFFVLQQALQWLHSKPVPCGWKPQIRELVTPKRTSQTSKHRHKCCPVLCCSLTPQLCMELSFWGLIQKLLFFQAVKD